MDNASSEEKERNGVQAAEFNYFKPLGRIALIFFIGLSFYLLVSAIVLLFLTRPDTEVKVPGLVGKQFSDVNNGLVRRGFKPELKFEDVYDIEDGIILEQYPENGEIVYEGSKIKLLVSRNRLSIEVPNLIGMELPFAKNKIRNLHSHNRSVSLSTGVISFIPSDKTPDNIVIDQSPRAGEKVTPDRRVNMLVSAGRTGVDMLMPDITGQSIDLCFDLLLAKGVQVDEEIVVSNDIGQAGRVLEQDPAKSAPIQKGQTVKLKIGYFPVAEHLYYAYERAEYVIDNDAKDAGFYEAYIEDNSPKRIAFAKNMKAGQKIDFVFHRSGNSRVKILHNKKVVKVLKFNVD